MRRVLLPAVSAWGLGLHEVTERESSDLVGGEIGHGTGHRGHVVFPGIGGQVDAAILVAIARADGGDLELDDAQRHQLHESLQATAKDFKDLRMEIWQKARTRASESLERIASQLPPDKAEKLRERAKSRLQPWGLLE